MEIFRFFVFWSQIIISTSLENLAFNKSATQSSNLHANKWLAGAAVDGNGNQMLSGNSCACTAYHKPTVWWRVDLGHVYSISKVKIFYRNEGTSFRLAGFKLYTTLQKNFMSNSPVYVNNNGDQDGSILPANFTVHYATYGKYVTLYKERKLQCVGEFGSTNTNYCALFELCEVEVLGCAKKKHGTDCQRDCPENCLYDVCAVGDGKCYGCKVGYTGDNCNKLCGAGTYGTGCSQSCSGNCKGGVTCDARNGTCPVGCSDGYKGTYCNKTCSPGTFGSLCSAVCGSCKGNATCDHVSGSCPNGCGQGVIGKYCKTRCNSGYYGYNCSDGCSGNCLNGVTCNIQTGYCDNGCAAGWKGHTCNTACSGGKYGLNCLNNCNGNCVNQTDCNRVDGSCKYGCNSGWKGNTCDQVCAIGKYGPGCSEYCGNCNKSMACDRHTGICPQGCSDGYKGKLCRERCDCGMYGANCSLVCVVCNRSCDHVTGECINSEQSDSTNEIQTYIQDLKLSFIVYGVISSVIICILSAALRICFIRQNISHRSETHTNKNDIAFSVSDTPGPNDNSDDYDNTKSSNSCTTESNNKQESHEKYEELAEFRGEINKYETLTKDKASTNLQDRKDTKVCKKTVDERSSDMNYEELQVKPSENVYDLLHNEDNSKYANC